MASPAPKALILMADYGHDPTETAVPYTIFKEAGFTVHIATENGSPPICDAKMLYGITQKLLGAPKAAVHQYEAMISDPAVQSPLSWTSPAFSLAPYNLVFLPGGHEKGVRQIIDSPIIHAHLSLYFPLTLKPSPKTVGAICHGVQVLAASKITSEDGKVNGKSVLHDATTTALPGMMESSVFWMTRLWLGDYYKTYGAGTANVETVVRGVLDDAGRQWRSSLSPSPFIHEDEKYNYVSGRFPPDAAVLAKRCIELVRGVYQS